MLDGDPGDNDAVLLATFAAILLIGTLASQIAAYWTWEEVPAELALERAEEGRRKWLMMSWQRLRELLEDEHADLPKPPEIPKD